MKEQNIIVSETSEYGRSVSLVWDVKGIYVIRSYMDGRQTETSVTKLSEAWNLFFNKRNIIFPNKGLIDGSKSR